MYKAGVVLLIVLLGCRQQAVTGLPRKRISGHSANEKALAALAGTLRTGDIVLKNGKGPYAYIFAHLNKREQKYGHCGIVVMENGYPCVYHCIGGEDNPDQRMRRDSLAGFFQPWYSYSGAVVRCRLGNAQRNAVADRVHKWYGERPRFDLKFDLATDSELYCSEFVYKTLAEATGDTAFFPVSHGHGKTFVGIDDLYLGPNAAIVAAVSFK